MAPIVLKTPEILLLLDGKEAETTRPVKPYPPARFCSGDVAAITNGKRWTISKLPGHHCWHPDPDLGILCPYPEGTKLWVRETVDLNRRSPRAIFPTFRADGLPALAAPKGKIVVFDAPKGQILPASVLPKWASRLMVEVVRARLDSTATVPGGIVVWAWHLTLKRI